MSKVQFKPGTFVYPVPSVMVSCGDMDVSNIFTVAWTGIICSDPAMTYISVRKERHSYDIIKKSGEFVINLTTENLVRQTDFAGVRSGKDIDKFKELKLTKEKGNIVKCPCIMQSPVSIECTVDNVIELGSHDMFLAKIVSVNVDEKYIDETGKFHMEDCNLIAYSHGHYYSLGKELGKFGFSVQKKK